MIPRPLTMTDPGSRWVAGSSTKTPCTLGNSRSAIAFVGHAVLQAQDRHVARRHLDESVESRLGLVRLRSQEHQVVVTPGDVRRITDRRDVEDHLGVGIAQAQPVLRQCVEVDPARHEHHGMSVLVEAATGGTTDRTRTDHDVAHSAKYLREGT